MIRLLLLASLALAACGNANFCPGHLDSDCRVPPDSPGPRTCTGDTDCSALTAVCDLAGSKTCVQCTTAEPSACTDGTPVCGTDNTCRACAAHSECASSVCLPTGFCGAEGDVAYVDPMGSDNDMCTKVMPCTKLAKALATARPYLKLTGSTNDTASINNQNVTILADPGATLTSTQNGLILEVKGSSKVAIYDLLISGASGPSGFGISLPAGNAATLDLHHATLSNNNASGISATGGTLTLSQSTISGNPGGGISATGSTLLTVSQSNISNNTGGGISTAGGVLTISRSTINGNAGGGISTSSSAKFNITNTFVFRNGNKTTSTFGGLNLQFVGTGNRLEFNTIVDNDANTNSGGIFCNVPTFSAPNNIVAHNSLNGSATDPNAQTFGSCTYPTSKIQMDLTGLAFEHPDSAPFSYKLTTGSSAVDMATTPSDIDVDNEGDHRPQGAQKDIGADELKP